MFLRVINYSLVAVLCTVLLSCNTVQTTGSNWKLVGETNIGDIQHYINAKSIQKNGNLTTVVTKNVLKKPETISFLNGKKYIYDINKWEFNCNKVQARLLLVEYYQQTSSEPIFSQTIQSPQLTPIPKESILEKIYTEVCHK